MLNGFLNGKSLTPGVRRGIGRASEIRRGMEKRVLEISRGTGEVPRIKRSTDDYPNKKTSGPMGLLEQEMSLGLSGLKVAQTGLLK